MATLKADLTLKHRPTLGEDTQLHHYKTGTKFEILKEWPDHYLCKNAEGQVFNIPKQSLDPS
jgi:hypothetical protein